MAIKGKMVVVNGAEYQLKEMQQAVRAGLEKAVLHWRQKFMPGHFESSAVAKYGYQPRKGDNEPPRIAGRKGRMISNPHYSWRKRRMKRHNRPLVFTGLSMHMAMRQAAVTFRRKGGLVRCRLSMPVPTYFYKYKPGQPNKYAELTRTTVAEDGELLRVINEAIAEHLRKMPRQVKQIVV